MENTLLNNILDQLTEGCQIIGFDRKILYLNETACKHTRCSKEQLIGQKYRELWPEAKTNKAFQLIEDCLENRVSSSLENQIKLPDGKKVWHQLDIKPVTEGALILSIDITARKKEDECNQYHLELLNQMGAAAKIGGWEFNVNTGEGTWTEEIAKIHDMDPSEETGRDVGLKVFHGESKIKIEEALKEAVELARPYDLKLEITTLKGNHKWIHIIGYPVVEDGIVVKLKGSCQDITGQKFAENELKRNEQLLRLFVKHSPAAVAMFDKDIRYIVASDRYKKNFRLPDEDLTGKLLYAVFPELPEEHINIHKRCFAGEILNDESYFISSDGKEDWVRWEIRPWYENNNTIGGSIFFGEFITERKKSEEELRRYASIITSSPDLMAIVGKDLRYKAVNKAYLKTFKVKRCDIIEHNVAEFYDKDFYESTVKPYTLKCLNGEKMHYFKWFSFPDHVKKYMEVNNFPFYDAEGKITGVVVNTRDVTEQYEARQALRESEIHFRTLSNNGQALIWTTGADKKLNYVNQPWLNFTGTRLDHELGKDWFKTVHPEDIEHCKTIYEQAFDKRERFSVEYRFRHVSGKFRWFQDNGTPRYNSEGEFIGYIGHCLDIDDRKKMEIQLKINHDRFLKAEKIGKVGNWEYDLRTTRFWASDETKRIFGLDMNKNEYTAEEIESCIPKREHVHQALIYLAEQNKEYRLEYDIYPKNSNQLKSILSIAELCNDEQDTPTKIVGVIQDITRRVEAEKLLRLSENKYKALVEQSLTGIYILDKNKFLYVNNRFCEIFGYSETELLTGRKPIDVIAAEDRVMAQNHINNRLNMKQDSVHYIAKGRHKQGKLLWVEIHYTYLNLENQNVITGTVLDITDRKLAEEKILKLNEELEEKVKERTARLTAMNKELQTFSYSVSHDLKAPLRGIDGYSQLLEELHSDQLDEEGRSFIKIIRESTSQMNQLIEDLLAYSRLERATFIITNINIRELIQNTLLLYRGELEARKISINNHIPDFEFFADKDGASIILRNIIENAIKFTREVEKPEIIFKLEEKQGSFVLCIKDNGIGFNMTFKDKIFEIFQRLNLPEQYPGTGVGLAMVNKTMKRIGGKVWAEGKLGEGSVFYLEFPIRKEQI
jgi:PAS domain S-box-containing protein